MGKRLSQVSGPEQDAQTLLKLLMPSAQSGLEEQEAFGPMAALVEVDGSVRRVGAEISAVAGDAASTNQAVAALRELLQHEAGRGVTRSAALAADVMIWRSKDGDEASSAVSVHVEHQDGYCVDLLVPYKVRKGMMSRLRRKPQVMFRKMIAQESEAVIFPAKREPGNSIDLQGAETN